MGQHRPWTATWCQLVPWTPACSPAAIQTTDINMALCCSRSPAAAWTTAISMASGGCPACHINMAPSSSMAHIHQHGFRQQHRPLIFAWPSVVIRPTHINMATAAVGEWTQTWPLVQLRPQISTWPPAATWSIDANMASWSWPSPCL